MVSGCRQLRKFSSNEYLSPIFLGGVKQYLQYVYAKNPSPMALTQFLHRILFLQQRGDFTTIFLALSGGIKGSCIDKLIPMCC
jgi:hypothetical protein